MSIPLNCPCGRSLKIKDDLAGRKIRCPACKSILTVPAAEEAEPEPVMLELIEDEPAEAQPVRPSRRSAIQAEPPEVLPARRRAREEEDDDEDEARPVKRRPKLKREIARAPKASGGFGGINAGVGGGAVMILIAIVWFIVGLVALNRIFFYPPILAVVGFIAIIKGLTGGD